MLLLLRSRDSLGDEMGCRVLDETDVAQDSDRHVDADADADADAEEKEDGEEEEEEPAAKRAKKSATRPTIRDVHMTRSHSKQH